MMTKQEIFNKVWDHFITKKNPQSGGADSACFYRFDRTPECPRRCAIGLFIPDAEYNELMEHSTGAFVAERSKTFSALWDRHGKAFWDSLQRAHDYAETFEDFESTLRHFAKQELLECPPSTV